MFSVTHVYSIYLRLLPLREREREEKMSESGKTVCVTGASGYIASWIVKLLLQRGYTVRATVRDPSDSKKTEHLRALDGASERLQLVKADLSEEGSFDSVMEGCDGVFHTASPVNFHASDPHKDLLDPAINGTLNVLKSCVKNPSVKRVVLTSSMAAVANNGKSRNPDVTVDETWFSDPEILKQRKTWYSMSKTLAEESAWKFSKENKLDLITINPGMVIGPLLQPTLNSSCAQIFDLINGETFPNNTFGWINVKDVAEAHVLAYENPSANGRYCLVERVLHHSAIVELLRGLYPSFQLPDKCVDDKPFTPVYKVSSEKAKSLGMADFILLEKSLQETIESFKDKGFIN